ncbi:hypothetical protein TrLO_g10054 [Triparma laevis f. longispina]|uniref:Uncharacterized protein n=1 Tax=Triparma laevis f. longispina TaxID=1714387 RepID=A0A9W7CAF0_9STRA|nr:hypothetical protein TrLO_g10054 [Triparma laevis f. longispina]
MSEFTQAAVTITSSSLSLNLPPLPTTSRGKNIVLSIHPKDPDKIIYASGKYVVVRSLKEPYGKESFVYRGHNSTVTVAKFSSNGNYIASADETGKLRVWASNTPEKKSKLEIQVLGGPVSDLAWDGESKKIVVCGDGGSSFHLRCIIWDTGNNAGEFIGHNKRATTVDYRQQRPFRIMSGSEDMKTVFYAGPPFKRDSDTTSHSNYVNCVRYSPDGEMIVSVGSDKKIVLYEGKTGVVQNSWENVHAGSIYSVSWSSCGTKILTTSADKTAKVIQMPSGEVEGTYTLGEKLGDFVVGGVMSGSTPCVVTLSGKIHILNASDFSASPTTINGHQGSVSSMFLDKSTGTLYTGSSDGTVAAWEAGTREGKNFTGGTNADLNGAVHGGAVTTINVADGNVITSGWDDTIRVGSAATGSSDGAIGLGGQPKCSGSSGSVVVIATKDSLKVVSGGSIAGELEISYTAQAIAVNVAGDIVVVGDSANKIHIYSLSGGDLAESNVVDGHTGAIHSLAFNSEGDKLAAGDVKEVRVWNTADWSPLIKGKWQFHTSQIKGLDWSSNGEYLASIGTDENLFIWCLAKKMRRLNYKFAHKGGAVGCAWIDEGKIVSAGSDGSIVEWDVAADMAEKFK